MSHKIILVRHGETQDNVEKRLQGWTDTPLNTAGIEQAKLVAKRLSAEKVSAIYSSDLVRASRTAEEIAHYHSLPVIIKTELREGDMGVFVGWQWEQENPKLTKLWSELEASRARGDYDWREHNGESYSDHFQRTKRFLDHVVKIHKDETIIAVTHGGSINRFAEIIGYKTLTSFVGYGNTSLTIIEKSSTAYLVTLHNDYSHLSDNPHAVLVNDDQ